jgi:hypothetical protein
MDCCSDFREQPLLIDLADHQAVVAIIDNLKLSFGPLIAVCCQAYISQLAHGTVVVLAPSELVRVAETARARLILALPAGH